jgi:hypothetical protein
MSKKLRNFTAQFKLETVLDGLRGEKDEETYSLFLKASVIGLGFSNIGDMRKIEADYQMIKQHWHRKAGLSHLNKRPHLHPSCIALRT